MLEQLTGNKNKQKKRTLKRFFLIFPELTGSSPAANFLSPAASPFVIKRRRGIHCCQFVLLSFCCVTFVIFVVNVILLCHFCHFVVCRGLFLLFFVVILSCDIFVIFVILSHAYFCLFVLKKKFRYLSTCYLISLALATLCASMDFPIIPQFWILYAPLTQHFMMPR